MKKVAKIVGLCSRPMQARYLAASSQERQELDHVVEQESSWIRHKMQRKGYQLEGTVAGVYGIFTRGPAQGTVELYSKSTVA